MHFYDVLKRNRCKVNGGDECCGVRLLHLGLWEGAHLSAVYRTDTTRDIFLLTTSAFPGIVYCRRATFPRSRSRSSPYGTREWCQLQSASLRGKLRARNIWQKQETRRKPNLIPGGGNGWGEGGGGSAVGAVRCCDIRTAVSAFFFDVLDLKSDVNNNNNNHQQQQQSKGSN